LGETSQSEDADIVPIAVVEKKSSNQRSTNEVDPEIKSKNLLLLLILNCEELERFTTSWIIQFRAVSLAQRGR